jgi:cyclophilin family peptidyl-prolyl cis-trans isomerase/HEAT repeat protein
MTSLLDAPRAMFSARWRRYDRGRSRLLSVALLALGVAASGCATAPRGGAAPAAPVVPVVTWEQKLAWMMRLEDQRILRDPNPLPPVILRSATRTEPALVAPPAPSDLLRLLNDEEPRVRRRAALAIGRVGLAEGIQPLADLLKDPEGEVRQMAAFALGLIGDPAARPALLAALAGADPLLQGRAAEALGQIGDRTDAVPVAAMVKAHVDAGVLSGIEPDDLTYALAPAVEAARLGMYALARLASYDALASAVLDPAGQPVSRWWPVAYAIQRIADARAQPVFMTLLETPGRYTASFAVRGLAATKAAQATGALRGIVEQRTRHHAVVLQAIRALVALGDASSLPVFVKILADEQAEPPVRVEAMAAVAALASSDSVDLLLDLVSSPQPWLRAPALRALARVDPDTFMGTLAGLDADRDWTVRVAIASALGSVTHERSLARLTAMLQDRDGRVVPAVIAAMAATKAPGIEQILIERLRTEDFVARMAAANALGDLKAAAAVPALIAAYRASAGDTTYVARAAILGALSRIDAAAARPLLQEALTDRDWALRLRAATLLREQGVTGTDATIRPAAPGRPVDSPEWQALVSPPFSPHAFIDTEKGTIEIELAVLDAPLTVDNFVALARKGFFNGIAIHRVVPDFVVQDGDPRGDGEGGPGYTIRDEINQRPYLRGTVGMALDWEDTGGSQFFITHSPQPHLDARYTVFGHVVNGMDVVDLIVPWDLVKQVRIWDGVSPQ